MGDIETEGHVKIMVDAFYDKVNKDDLVSPIFNDLAHVNWVQHLPVMYAFWSSILLGSGAYSGQPFPKHMALPIEKLHFDRWLQLFMENMDENFSGPVAEEAKVRARTIASVFQYKMGIIKPD
jgi:hemoglobin